MSDSSSSNRSLPGNAGRHTGPNVSGGWIVMILAFLIAVVVYFVITQKQGQQFTIAVAANDIAAGAKVTPSSFRLVEVNLPNAQLEKLVTTPDQINGQFTAVAIHAGDPVLKTNFVTAADSDGQRAMSIPVDATRSAGGKLTAGDTVDVVDVAQGGFIGRNLRVLSVNSGSGSALSGSSQFSVTVAVTQDQISALSTAINNKKFDIIRSTGAAPLSVSVTSTTLANAKK